MQILTSKAARQSRPSSLPLPAKFRRCEFSFWPNFASANFTPCHAKFRQNEISLLWMRNFLLRMLDEEDYPKRDKENVQVTQRRSGNYVSSYYRNR